MVNDKVTNREQTTPIDVREANRESLRFESEGFAAGRSNELRGRDRSAVRSNLAGWLFASPWIIGFVALFGWPFLASLYWSFTSFDLVNEPRWVGWANYENLARQIWTQEAFGLAISNTLYYIAFSVPLSVATGVMVATMLSQDIPGQRFFRTVVFLPSVIPVVAVSVLWLWLLDPRQGWVNYLLSGLGLPSQNWLNQSRSAISWETCQMLFGTPFSSWTIAGSKDALILLTVWGIGNYMVIYLAAIKDIPRALYEAASLDGAGPIRKFWNVTLPMLSPILLFHVIIGLIRGVQTFTSVYILSEGTGEPGGSLMTLSLQLFVTAFNDLRVGEASAMAWIILVLLAGATYWLFKTSRNWVHYRAIG